MLNYKYDLKHLHLMLILEVIRPEIYVGRLSNMRLEKKNSKGIYVR
jgi:hypothetical protein